MSLNKKTVTKTNTKIKVVESDSNNEAINKDDIINELKKEIDDIKQNLINIKKNIVDDIKKDITDDIKNNLINNEKKKLIEKRIIGGRPKKSELFMKERNEILNKLNEILGITETNKKFFMWDVDNNKDMQKRIMEMKDDVSKYFGSKNTALYTKDTQERDYFILLRLIYKEMGYKMIHADTKIMRNNIKVYSGCYMLDK
jgi:hypothetical protein